MAVWSLLALGLALSACYNPMSPVEINALSSTSPLDRSCPIAALDYQVGDLTDPAVVAKLARADLLVLGTWQFWETNADLSHIRAANPNIKIVAYLRTKCVRSAWSPEEEDQDNYTHQLYRAALPHIVYTTEGDTASDWYDTYLYDFTNPQARSDILDIFTHFQTTSRNQFDGVFWDYFSPMLWVPDNLPGVYGDPDMDGDGVAHFDDADEIDRFLRGQEAWIDEMRARMGEDFIQIANGVRALRDSTFAAKVDGMFYEDFPAQGYNGMDEFRMALDPGEFNNLWAAHGWPRTQNGGPWLILSHVNSGGVYYGPYPDYELRSIDADDLTRAVALLTGGSAITYESVGIRHAGIPEVEYDLGPPLGGVQNNYPFYRRDFERGHITLTMRNGAYPYPFDFEVWQDGVMIHRSPYPAAK
ncbi:putative glycoside hydrolase family 15 protein [bacterium]|nr:putative glycoside hydrolase family 15 protein [bacterium]